MTASAFTVLCVTQTDLVIFCPALVRPSWAVAQFWVCSVRRVWGWWSQPRGGHGVLRGPEHLPDGDRPELGLLSWESSQPLLLPEGAFRGARGALLLGTVVTGKGGMGAN